MDKDSYYKNLYHDIINDTYNGKSIMINNNKELLKILFSKCSKSMLSESNFSFSYIKRCFDFVSKLTEEEREMVNDGFMSFFNVFNNESFTIMKYLLHPNLCDTMHFISKILSNLNYYGYSNLNTNNLYLANLNEALIYYKSVHNDKHYTNIITLLFIYCFKLNSYEYLYNYLNNPDYYHDKLYNSGILSEYEFTILMDYNFYYISQDKYLYNKLMNNFQFVFPINKKMIR